MSGGAHDSRDAPSRTIQLVISSVLRTGVLTSLGVILAGLALDLARNSGHRSSGTVAHHLFTPSAPYPHTFTAIFDGVIHGDAVSIMVLGLVILLATPIVNVAVSAITFVHERDARFVAITTLVLVVLIGSFALGKVGG